MQTSSRRPNEVTLILVLGMLSAFGPLAIDMYLPAFPSIARDLGASATQVGWTLAVYFAGLAIGQLVVGPATDRFGRTRPLRLGIALFALGSAGAAVAPRIELLIAARLVQSLGGAACSVVSRAVIRDLYRGAEAARMNSRMVLVMGAAPILAPLLGGALLAAAGWRAIFVVKVVLSLAALAVVIAALPETAPAHTPAPRGAVARAILGDRGFIGHAMVVSLAISGLFAYITAAPLVYITLHHVDPRHFGWYFGSNAAAFIGASQLNARMVVARRPANLLIGGLALGCTSAIGFMVVAVTDLGLAPTAACLFLFLASLGFVLPNATAIALEDQGARAGSASAWIGALQFGTAAAASSLVSSLADGTARPVAAIMLGFILAAVATLVVTRRGAPRTAHRALVAPPGSGSDAAA